MANVQTKLQSIFQKTQEHGTLLAKWVCLYKILLFIFRRIEGGKDNPWHHFVAGFIGGYYIWGKKTAVSNQINMYVMSRVFFGLWEILK
eukprot:UN03549